MVHLSPPFLSSIVFGSYLVYPSSATGKEDYDARSFTLGVKRDRVTARGRLIEIAVTELERNLPRDTAWCKLVWRERYSRTDAESRPQDEERRVGRRELG